MISKYKDINVNQSDPRNERNLSLCSSRDADQQENDGGEDEKEDNDDEDEDQGGEEEEEEEEAVIDEEKMMSMTLPNDSGTLQRKFIEMIPTHFKLSEPEFSRIEMFSQSSSRRVFVAQFRGEAVDVIVDYYCNLRSLLQEIQVAKYFSHLRLHLCPLSD